MFARSLQLLPRVLDLCCDAAHALRGSRRRKGPAPSVPVLRAGQQGPARQRVERQAAALRDAHQLWARACVSIGEQEPDAPAAASAWGCGAGALSGLASLALLLTARQFAADVRAWFAGLDRARAQRVSGFFTDVLAPLVVEAELADVARARAASGGGAGGALSVRGSRHARQVAASYDQGECTVDVRITMPPDYPLHLVDVDCRGSLGMRADKWRRWQLQIRSLVAAGSGSLLDAVLQWKSNVEAELDGVEPCPICYCVVAQDRALPRLACRVCGTKFHNTCLYKWFQSSNNTTCPMCRTPFM